MVWSEHANSARGPIEVKRVILEGKVDSIQPLSDEWHNQNVGLREVGIVFKWIHEGHPPGKYFKITTITQNPFNSDYPAVEEYFPVSKKDAKILEKESVIGPSQFYAYNKGLYRKVWDWAGIPTLVSVTENCEPEKIEGFFKIN